MILNLLQYIATMQLKYGQSYYLPDYCTQYISMLQLTTLITDEGDAVQFLASARTATAVDKRPVQNPSVEDLLEYTLKTEVQTTAKNGVYYGTI